MVTRDSYVSLSRRDADGDGPHRGLLKETYDEATPLQRELDRTGKMLGIVVVVIAIVMLRRSSSLKT